MSGRAIRYLIDGYNLLHATGHLSGPTNALGLRRARLVLLEALRHHFGGEGGGAVVVFDARGAPAGVPEESTYHGARVLNALDREADDVIEDLIRRHATPAALTVVSDDHRVREAARRRRCRTMSCLDFFETLSRRAAPAPSSDSEDAKPEPTLSPEDEALLRELERDEPRRDP
jgi:predicted RNA-binding protein with PIN domain